MRVLDVYLLQHLTGQLIQDDNGHMVFSYNKTWLANPHAIALSYSLPLRDKPFTRDECHGFFAGILPEENKRELIAKNLGISARNDFAMLAEIGGECAGAVTFIQTGEVIAETNQGYRSLSDSEIIGVLQTLPSRPLMAGEDEIRLSLAGAQDKLAIHIDNGHIAMPLNGAPSTHILKPQIEHFDNAVLNEFTCMQLAKSAGLHVANVAIETTGGIDYLLIERYDRYSDSNDHIKRLHQEDFCQAMNITSTMKYQREGGPSLMQCFSLLRAVSSAPVIDLQRLLDGVIFNYLIGNNDAHGKNFSLLYSRTGEIRLAPFYDLLCTVYYPGLSANMAMKIGGAYAFEWVFPQHFKKFAKEAGLTPSIVVKRVIELANSVLSCLPKVIMVHPGCEGITQKIETRINAVLTRFSH